MSIQFACPSCRQPIEIDDEWASQEVSCPFCQKIIKAPASTTWHAAPVPQASPLSPPPPPPGVDQARFEPGAGRHPMGRTGMLGIWAVALTAIGWVLLLASMIMAYRIMAPTIKEITETYTRQADRQQAMMETFQEELATNPSRFQAIGLALMVGVGSLLCGLILTFLSLARHELGRNAGIAILALWFLPMCTCVSSMFVSPG